MSTDTGGLAAQQRAVLALVKDRPLPPPSPGQGQPAPSADPYLDRARDSRGLAMVRTIRAQWLRFALERCAPLTSSTLAHAGRFEAELARLGRAPQTPTAIDGLGLHFTERHAADTDPLIAAVAATEHALILLAHGDRARHDVPWDRNPAPVLDALLAGRVPPAAAPGGFLVTVSHELSQLIRIQRVP